MANQHPFKSDRKSGAGKGGAPVFHPGEHGFAGPKKGVQSVVGSVFDAAPCHHDIDEGYRRLGKSKKTKGGQ